MKKAIFLIFIAIAATGCGKKQKIIFEAESIGYSSSDSSYVSKIQTECRKISESLNIHIHNGWKVIAASPKEKLVLDDKGRCIGTEYILEK